MSNDTQNPFDKSAWLVSMLFETDRFGAAIADQAYLVRNEEEAHQAWLRANRFPKVVCQLTYDYENDEPRDLDPDDWWNGDAFQRAAGAEMAEEIEAELRRDAYKGIIESAPSALGAIGASRMVLIEGSLPCGLTCVCGLRLYTATQEIPHVWCAVCHDEEIAEAEQARRDVAAAE